MTNGSASAEAGEEFRIIGEEDQRLVNEEVLLPLLPLPLCRRDARILVSLSERRGVQQRGFEKFFFFSSILGFS
jgi:hypothetical protein